jgi:hypothetical protein
VAKGSLGCVNNEHSGFMKGRKFLDQLSDYHRLKKDSVPWSFYLDFYKSLKMFVVTAQILYLFIWDFLLLFSCLYEAVSSLDIFQQNILHTFRATYAGHALHADLRTLIR